MASDTQQDSEHNVLTSGKGLFSSPDWKFVMSTTAHERLTKWLQDSPPAPGLSEGIKSRYKEAERVLGLVGQMPKEKVWFTSKLGDRTYGTAMEVNLPQLCYSVMSVGAPSNKSIDKTPVIGGPSQWGWDLLKQVNTGWGTKGLKYIANLAKKDIGEVTLPQSSVMARVLKQAQAFDNGEITLTSNDPEDALSSADAAMIFLGRDGQSGYADKHDRAGPIGGARLFESAAAATRTARAHGWQGECLIALVRVELVGLDASADHQVKGGEALMAAIAKVERQALRKALNRATIEDLKEQLARRKAMDSDEERETPAESTPKKRRM